MNAQALVWSVLSTVRRFRQSQRSHIVASGAADARSTMRFVRKGLLAIEPKALDQDFAFHSSPDGGFELLTGELAYLTIRGTMSHHPEWYFESYDNLLSRFAQAFQSSAQIVFVSGDTPGGDVSGCFDGARQVLQMKERSGKLLVWYVDGQTCSAGLAWAMAADHIVVPPEARFGSIGVIAELHSYKDQADASGMRSKLITSGARKADGHPLAEITDEVEAAVQASVDYEANLFYEWVSERRDLSVDVVRDFDAGVFHGQQAIDVGLADTVLGESAALAMCAGAEFEEETDEAPDGAERDDEMSAKTLAASAQRALTGGAAQVASSANGSMKKIRKMLGEAAAGDDEDAETARQMLGIKGKSDDDDDEDKPHKEPNGDEEENEEEDSASASAEDDAEDDEASSSAEDDDASNSAEDEDDAKRAESEDGEAKKCEDDAKRAEAAARDARTKARTLLRSGDKNSAKEANRLFSVEDRENSRAVSLRRESKIHRSNAATLRSNAAVNIRLNGIESRINKRIPKAFAKHPAAAAIATRGAIGSSANDTEKAPPKEFLAAAGLLASTAPVRARKDGGLHLSTVASPEQAKEHLAALNKRVAGGA